MRALLLPLCLAVAAAAAAPAYKGFVYASFSRGGFSSNASDASLDDVAATRVEVIELMATYYVANSVNATAIAPSAYSPSDADVLHAVAAARARGLRVAFKPHVDCLDGVWRAFIGTGFTTAAQWADWFSNYTAFLLHFAGLARSAGGDLVGFNVGTELDGTHAHAAEWRAVIDAVRGALPGVPLWLGPNWNWKGAPGYTLVSFWDALDYLGVDMCARAAARAAPRTRRPRARIWARHVRAQVRATRDAQ